jgi:hypothetical protein
MWMWPQACGTLRLLLLQLLLYVAADLLHPGSAAVTYTHTLKALPANRTWQQVPAVV